MSKYITYEDRLEIESRLTRGESFNKISEIIGKNRSTVGREVKQYSLTEKRNRFSPFYNPCVYRDKCKKQNICGDKCKKGNVKYCSKCGICCDKCDEFEEEICLERTRPPYVCNGCYKMFSCSLEKTVYYASKAQEMSENAASESRKGFILNENDIIRINSVLTPLVYQGQSLHQIYGNHKDMIMCSEKSLYNYVDSGILEVRNIDLPRKVRYRPRKKKKEFKVDKKCYKSRSYADYQKFLLNNKDARTVQMDSVIGAVGGKVLLTIHFVECSFMMAFIRDANTSQSVTDIFDDLYQRLGRQVFMKLFPVILTDRGSEFSNPLAIEFGPDLDDVIRTKVFYCDPSSPYQKGAIEVNHELIRRIMPKGYSFDNLTQDNVNVIMNHINSYGRKKLGGKCPYEVFEFIYGKEPLDLLGYSKIPEDKIYLSKRLLYEL